MELPDVADGAVQVAPPLVIGALVSGTGRSVANLHAACTRGQVPARVAVVVATRAETPALERCRALGIPTQVVPAEPAATFDDRVDDALKAHGVELVCLCGYLRRFRADAWHGRAINIHPALLPDFGGHGMFGRRVHEAVLASGRRESGCTVHWVSDEYDRGEVILQMQCPVEPGDSPDSLAERVFAVECLAYPQAVTQVARALRGVASS